MEEAQDRVLEGLALACFACGAREGVVLVRSEYPRALTRTRQAVERAYADGHLGARVHGSEVTLHVRVAAGAGSYVAGEETALIAGLEGGRGCSRAVAVSDRRGAVGCADRGNVETLAAVP